MKKKTTKARLDKDGTAKGKTELRAVIVSTNPYGIGTCFPGPVVAHVDLETGVTTSLVDEK